jgi:hypothetical protein
MRAFLLMSVCAACGSSQPAATAPTPTCPVASSSAPVVAASSPSASASATATATTIAPPPPREPPPELVTALDGAMKAIASSDWPNADKQLATATAAASADAHLAYLVARVRAVRWASVNDFEKAASAFVAVIPSLAKHPELKDEFWAHNAMMMIREAQGDPAAALAENDQATLAAARGTWDPPGRETLAFQKDRWHRAYLTRMLAESRTGSAKQALVAYAESALADYRTRGFGDSVAILEAYFAALDGKKDAALAAAKRVDAAKDDDVEDLYLVVVGLDAGGDRSGADAVRKIMRATPGVHIARSIMLHWLDLDAKGAGFTPRHANAR